MRHIIVATILACLTGALSVPTSASAQVQEPTPSESRVSVSKVNLNTADQQTLETLPGIGPRMAELIIEYRNESGGFEKVEELMNVRGIGERTFLRLRELVEVEHVAAPR